MKMLPQRIRLGNLTCQQDRAVFTTADLRSIFPERTEGTFTFGSPGWWPRGMLKRAARAARGGNVCPQPRRRLHIQEWTAAALQRATQVA